MIDIADLRVGRSVEVRHRAGGPWVPAIITECDRLVSDNCGGPPSESIRITVSVATTVQMRTEREYLPNGTIEPFATDVPATGYMLIDSLDDIRLPGGVVDADVAETDSGA